LLNLLNQFLRCGNKGGSDLSVIDEGSANTGGSLELGNASVKDVCGTGAKRC